MVRLMDSQDFHALEYDGTSYDCGSKLGYFRANLAYATSDPEHGEAARAMLKDFG